MNLAEAGQRCLERAQGSCGQTADRCEPLSCVDIEGIHQHIAQPWGLSEQHFHVCKKAQPMCAPIPKMRRALAISSKCPVQGEAVTWIQLVETALPWGRPALQSQLLTRRDGTRLMLSKEQNRDFSSPCRAWRLPGPMPACPVRLLLPVAWLFLPNQHTRPRTATWPGQVGQAGTRRSIIPLRTLPGPCLSATATLTPYSMHKALTPVHTSLLPSKCPGSISAHWSLCTQAWRMAQDTCMNPGVLCDLSTRAKSHSEVWKKMFYNSLQHIKRRMQAFQNKPHSS